MGVDAIIEFAQGKATKSTRFSITHYHQDHLGGTHDGAKIQGAADMLGKVKAKVYVNKHEAEGARKVAGLERLGSSSRSKPAT